MLPLLGQMTLAPRHLQRIGVGLFCAVAVSVVSSAHAAEGSAASEAQARALVKSLQVSSPYRISDQALTGKIRYELAFSDGAGLSLPETGEQHVEQRGDHLIVTICRDRCGQEAAPSEAELNRFLQPNRWVQSKDEVIADFARVGRPGDSVDQRMPSLAKAVADRMSGPIEFQHYWTAREAYDYQSGDCSEFAVLLAAAARARNIPTRVVAGLAYSSRFLFGQHVFGPHMWVQSWNGVRWVSYDAALGDFDAGHIALVLGDGTPAGFRAVSDMIHKLRIVSAVGLVRAVPGSAH
jgi:transglutaminase-like putative cysteine protease